MTLSPSLIADTHSFSFYRLLPSQIAQKLATSSTLGIVLAWYYSSFVGHGNDMMRRKTIGIAWDYIYSYATLFLYTLVLTLRCGV